MFMNRPNAIPFETSPRTDIPCSPVAAPPPCPTPNPSTANASSSLPPPSLVDILSAFSKDGGGDRDLLLAILGAKRAEEERLASQLAYQSQLFLLQQQYAFAFNAASSSSHAAQHHATSFHSPHNQQHPSSLLAQQQQQQQQQQQAYLAQRPLPSPVPTSPSAKSTASESASRRSSASERSPSLSSSSSMTASSSSSSRYHPYSPAASTAALSRSSPPPITSTSNTSSKPSMTSSGEVRQFRSVAMAQINSTLLAKRAARASGSTPPTPLVVPNPTLSPMTSTTTGSVETSPPSPSSPVEVDGSASPLGTGIAGSNRMMVSDLLGVSPPSRISREKESFMRGGSRDDEDEE